MDNRRINRDIQVSKFPQMTLFWWSGKGQNASQKIEVKAEAQAPDGSMDNGECDLVVHVKGGCIRMSHFTIHFKKIISSTLLS